MSKKKKDRKVKPKGPKLSKPPKPVGKMKAMEAERDQFKQGCEQLTAALNASNQRIAELRGVIADLTVEHMEERRAAKRAAGA